MTCTAQTLHPFLHQTLMAKGISVSANPKVMDSSSVADGECCKDLRDKSDDDTFMVIKGKKVNQDNIEHLSGKELLQEHIKIGKKVRMRLIDQRLDIMKRNKRNKRRLALFLPPLPPIPEQQKTDGGPGSREE